MKPSDEEIRRLLRRVDPPAGTHLDADLWPRMRERLAGQDLFRLNWFDRAVLVAASLGLLFFPQAAAQLLAYL